MEIEYSKNFAQHEHKVQQDKIKRKKQNSMNYISNVRKEGQGMCKLSKFFRKIETDKEKKTTSKDKENEAKAK